MFHTLLWNHPRAMGRRLKSRFIRPAVISSLGSVKDEFWALDGRPRGRLIIAISSESMMSSSLDPYFEDRGSKPVNASLSSITCASCCKTISVKQGYPG